MLTSSLEDSAATNRIVKQLNTCEKIHFVCQYAYLIYPFFYVQLQEDQWKYYYNVGINEIIWSGRVSYIWSLEKTH